MKQNSTTPVARRAQHQPRRDTFALEDIVQRQLNVARATDVDLDLEIVGRSGFKLHLRVIDVRDGLVIGIRLDGFGFDSPRSLLGKTAIHVSGILMIERTNLPMAPSVHAGS
jgi:hypothetical protein